MRTTRAARVTRAVRRPPMPRNLRPVTTPSWRSARPWNSVSRVSTVARHSRYWRTIGDPFGVDAARLDQRLDRIERLLVADHLRLERLEALVEQAGAEVLPERRVATSISSRATRPLMFGVVACGLLGSSRSGMTLTRKTPCPSAHGEKAGWGPGRGGRPLGRRRTSTGTP
jgi:hypothetical protein